MNAAPAIEDLFLGEAPADAVGGGPAGDHTTTFDAGEFSIRRWLEDVHYWHLHRRAVVLDLLRRFELVRGVSWIELGCGAGTVATYLNENGCSVDYGELHREGLQAALERARLRLGSACAARRFIRLDVTRHVPGARYRGVLLLDVLEHLPDDGAALRHLRGWIDRSSGPAHLVVTVPAYRWLWSPWDTIQHHQRRYTARSLSALLRGCGFDPVYTGYVFAPLVPAAAAVKFWRALRRAAAGGGAAGPRRITDLVEATPNVAVNAMVLRVLALERPWLRRARLPFGTSVTCVARTASQESRSAAAGSSCAARRAGR